MSSQVQLAGALGFSAMLLSSLWFPTSLDYFNPTEDEFRTIFKFQKGLDDAFNPLVSHRTPEEAQQLFEAKARMKAELRQALGESRYLEYEKGIDPSYQILKTFSDQHVLSENTVEDVYRIQRVAEAQAFSVREHPKMSTEQRIRVLEAIQRETEKEIAKVLDEEQLIRFRQSNVSGWLKRLEAHYHVNSEPIIDRAFSPH